MNIFWKNPFATHTAPSPARSPSGMGKRPSGGGGQGPSKAKSEKGEGLQPIAPDSMALPHMKIYEEWANLIRKQYQIRLQFEAGKCWPNSKYSLQGKKTCTTTARLWMFSCRRTWLVRPAGCQTSVSLASNLSRRHPLDFTPGWSTPFHLSVECWCLIFCFILSASSHFETT